MEIYQREIHFYETDAMGVVHHSNYLRFFEEARVDWIKKRGLSHCHYPQRDMTLAVIETQCHHYRPVFLGDQVSVKLQVRQERLKIHFRYAIFSSREVDRVAEGSSVHVPLNKELEVTRIPKELKHQLENEQWTETWP